MKTAICILTIVLSHISFSQDKTLSFPANDTVNIKDSIPTLNFDNQEPGKITYKKSVELDEVNEFVGKHKDDPSKVRIDGFRVQIYFNENKTTALGQKANFISQHTEHKAYLDYLAPNYRVRVGNFRTKLEAEKLKQELLDKYPTCIIIKDHIELPTIKSPAD
ncbi:MAG: SPOR domain-containing protein [Crocinitomicaceae bacterium]